MKSLFTLAFPAATFAADSNGNKDSAQNDSEYSTSETVTEESHAEYDTNVTLWFTEKNATIDSYKVSKRPEHRDATTPPLQWERGADDSVNIEWFYPEGTTKGKWSVYVDGQAVAENLTSTQATIDVADDRYVTVVGSVEAGNDSNQRHGYLVGDTIPDIPDLEGEPLDEALGSVAAATAESGIQLSTATVTWDAFIPDAYVQPLGTNLMCSEAQGVNDPWYNGNGKYESSTGSYTERPFYTGHPNPKDSKTFTRGHFSFSALKDNDYVSARSSKYVGETILFDRIQETGSFDRYVQVERATASDDDIEVDAYKAGPFEGGVSIRHNVKNPLCSLAPGITYDLLGKVNRNGTFIMEGVTDKAPSHALNISWLEKYSGSDTRSGTACVVQEDIASFAHLAPGTPNYFFSISGNVLSHGCKPGTVDPFP